MKNSKNLWILFLRRAESVLKAGMIFFISAYQLVLSPLLGGACRYSPSCSEYAVEAVKTHKPLYAIQLIIKRILRCRPGAGFGYDPVPHQPCECRGHQ